MFEFLNRIFGYNPQLEVTGLAKCKRNVAKWRNIFFFIGNCSPLICKAWMQCQDKVDSCFFLRSRSRLDHAIKTGHHARDMFGALKSVILCLLKRIWSIIKLISLMYALALRKVSILWQSTIISNRKVDITVFVCLTIVENSTKSAVVQVPYCILSNFQKPLEKLFFLKRNKREKWEILL